MRTILIEATAWNATTGADTFVALGGGGKRAYRHRARNDWIAGIVAEPNFAGKIDFDENGFSGGAIPEFGVIEFRPSSNARIASVAGLLWNGAAIEVLVGDDELAAPVWTTLIKGTVELANARGGAFYIKIRDISGDLDAKVASDRFTGAGGVEGETFAAERLKRRSFGRCSNIEALPLKATTLIYEVGDTGKPLQSIDDIKDMGRSASAIAVVAWAGSAAATLAALEAQAVVAGGGAAAPSIACVKWWTQPVGPLTVDLKGEVGAGYVDKVASIAERIIATRSAITISNTAAALVWRAGESGIHFGEPNETIAQGLDRLLKRSTLAWAADASGIIRLAEFTFAAPVETLTATDIARNRTFKPLLRRRVGFRPNNRIHSESEISAALRDDAGAILTAGADWTTGVTNRPANLAALVGSEGVNNTLVSIAANGALAGAGGGSVTLPGLGAGTLATYNEVPASALNLAPGNLILDPMIEEVSWWNLILNSIFDSTPANFAALGAPRAWRSTGTGNAGVYSGLWTCAPGKIYQAGFSVLVKAGATNYSSSRIRWYTQAGAYISSSGQGFVNFGGVAAAADYIALCSVTGTAPVNAAYGILENFYQNATAGLLFMAFPFAREVLPASGIVQSDSANMIVDPDFADPAGWSYTNNAFRSLNATAGEGAGTYKLTIDTTVAGTQISPFIPVPPGKTFRITTWAKMLSGTAGSINVQVQWYDATGTLVSNAAVATLTTQVGRAGALLVAPANTAQVRFRYQNNAGGAGGRIIEVSEPRMLPAPDLAADITGSLPTANAVAGLINASVTIGSNGALAGGGGGQVTLVGVGFSGDTDAQRNSRITIISGAIANIGTGTGAMVGNTSITLSGNTILGIGTGAGTAVVNAGVSIAANGALAGGGGGSVTIAGLGFIGELNADLTATAQLVIVAPSAVTVHRDYLGAPKTGQLGDVSVILTPVVKLGGVDKRTDATITYAATFSGVTGTINNTGGSADKGRITLTAGGPGLVTFTVTRGGIAYGPFAIPVGVVDDPPPTSSGGGGGGGIKSRSDASLGIVTATAFNVMTATHGGETVFLIDLVSGESLYASCPVTYNWTRTGASGTIALVAKWQYSPDNVTWTDFPASPITGSDATWNNADLYGDPGYAAVTQTQGGLATGQWYVRMVGAKSANVGNDITPVSGAAFVEAKV